MAGHGSIVINYFTKYGETPPPYSTVNNYELGSEAVPVLTAIGMKHLGWYTTETFEENSKVDKDTFIDPGHPSFTLYAKWESLPCLVEGESLYSIANAIREKSEIDKKLEFPNGFVEEIENLKNKYDTCTLKINNGLGGMNVAYGVKVENNDITYFEHIAEGYNTDIVIENVLCNSIVMFEFPGYGGFEDDEIENCTILYTTFGKSGALYLNTSPGEIASVRMFSQK